MAGYDTLVPEIALSLKQGVYGEEGLSYIVYEYL